MKYTDIEKLKSKTPNAGVLQRVTRRRVRQVNVSQGMQEGMKDARLNYRAGRPSNFRTTLIQLGGTADAHYQNSFEFWKIREYVRDYDRNTPILGQAVDRALDQLLGVGPWIDPQTGDDDVDATAKALWTEWEADPELCDFTWRMPFCEMERLALRHRFVDGDHFAVLDDAEGKVLLIEGDRVDSSGAQRIVTSGSGQPVADLVHGIEIDGNSRPLYYHIRKMRIGERQQKRRIFSTVESDAMIRVPREHVIHIVDPKRVTQSRGVSAFAPVFDRVSMHEDVEFAQLVQQQVAACIAAFITSDNNQQWGPRSSETGADGTELEFDEFNPGMIARLKPGESIETFSPRNPTSDARMLAMQIVREIGLSLGMPLELAMLVTSDTTFHGYRGLVEAYKITAKRQRKQFVGQFRSRIYRWKISQWVAANKLPNLPTVDRHVVRYPAWRYVEPEKESKANALRKKEHLASPRQIAAEDGVDHEQMVLEIAADSGALIEAAMAEAKRLNSVGGDGSDKGDSSEDEITWRDVLGIDPAPTAPSDLGDPGSNPGNPKPRKKEEANATA